jgi:hypothetical protein
MSLTSADRSHRGSAMVVVLVLLAMIIIFVTSSFVSVRILGDELRHIDQKQKQRIGQLASGAPAPAAEESPGNPA